MKKNATLANTTAPAWIKGCEGISAYANVSRRTAQHWLSTGLPARRVTKRLVLVKPADVDAFIERQSEEHASRIGA
jgi:hypothetical protein